MDRPALLARIPLFKGIARPDLEKLAKLLVERRFPAGATVFEHGTVGDRMYILVSGRAQASLPSANGASGEQITLSEFMPGDHFGELALFDDQPRSATVKCTETSVLLGLSRAAFISDVVRSPNAVLAVLGSMADRLRRTNTMLSSQAAKDAVRELSENLTWSQRLADRVAALNGSWAFILFLVGTALLWAAANAFLPRPFDGYPYTFFNLLLGLLVALQGPLIVMSQNRQAMGERAQAASDFRVNLKNELGIESLLREVALLRRETSQRLAMLEVRDPTRSSSLSINPTATIPDGTLIIPAPAAAAPSAPPPVAPPSEPPPRASAAPAPAQLPPTPPVAPVEPAPPAAEAAAK